MSAQPPALPVGPELTIPFAAEWHAKLLGHLAGHDGDLRLNLASVTDFDSTGVQLLLATRASLSQRGDALVLDDASAPVCDALTLFGLADLLPPAA